MPAQFDFYDGGGLDISFLSFAEFDRDGNINVHKFNGKIMGTGGFVDICQNSKKAIFAGTLKAGGLKESVEGGTIRIRQEGKFIKAVEKVPEITFNGRNAVARGQEVVIITERAVFRLRSRGLCLRRLLLVWIWSRDIIDQNWLSSHHIRKFEGDGPQTVSGGGHGAAQNTVPSGISCPERQEKGETIMAGYVP